jgi:hypothetical protein
MRVPSDCKTVRHIGPPQADQLDTNISYPLCHDHSPRSSPLPSTARNTFTFRHHTLQKMSSSSWLSRGRWRLGHQLERILPAGAGRGGRRSSMSQHRRAAMWARKSFWSLSCLTWKSYRRSILLSTTRTYSTVPHLGSLWKTANPLDQTMRSSYRCMTDLFIPLLLRSSDLRWRRSSHMSSIWVSAQMGPEQSSFGAAASAR